MMDCDRAFLSLVDNRSQYICAEMTRDQSLGRQNPSQPLLLGTARIPLEWGVCPYTMSVFHGKTGMVPETPYIVADPSYFYIKDFRQVPLFAARPYVAGYPNMVSYIEVPLRSLSGYILGSYCVVDNRSRDFLEPALLETIREATSAISSYLDMKRAEVNRTRSEKMMNGLRQFIASDRHIPPPKHTVTQASGFPAGPFELDVFRQSLHTSPSSSANENIESEQHSHLSANGSRPEDLTDDRLNPTRSKCPTVHSSKDSPLSSTLHQQNVSECTQPDLSSQIGDLFARAAKTIGTALDVDGLVFFDAIKPSTPYHESRLSFSFTTEEYVGPMAHGDDPGAVVLSEYQGDYEAGRHLVRKPSQSTIKRLTTRYPQGHVFVTDEYGILDYSADHPVDTEDIPVADNDQKDILECISKARYAIFLPLWHYQRESCFATCLAWVSDSAKTLDTGDVNSLVAFGNSLMVEILRLEALANAQSKSDFVSSISHELRSPLHGIVATIELMQEDVQDPGLLSMMEMIELCSSTLLDTFDHLLRFAKINSHTSSAPSNPSNPRPDGAPDPKRVVDLGSLLEDVVEVVSLGHSQALQMELGLKKEQHDAHADETELAPSKPVLVMTYIESDCDWLLHIETGAWKRILMNVLSNALKYTELGHIDLSLRMSKKAHNSPRYINLSVTDTGVGMSIEFLKYHLFTPFMQENHLSPGTGLGLSLVKSIVESLGGNISIESRQREGTCVTINVPIDEDSRIPETSKTPNRKETFAAENESGGQSLGLVSIVPPEKGSSETVPRIVSSPRVLQRTVRNICQGKLDITVVESSEKAIPETDIVMLDTYALTLADDLDWGPLFAGFTILPSVIVLGTAAKGLEQCLNIRKVTYLDSPITGQKLQAALLTAQTTKNTSLTSFLPVLPHRDKQASSEHSHPELASDNISSECASRSSEGPPTVQLPMHSLQVAMGPGTAPSLAVTSRFKRFLLVDDNPINLKLLVAFIRRIDRPFSTAADGAEAVRLYQQAASEEARPYDCIFMDISMPVMDGFQATAAIRQFEQSQSHDTNSDTGKKGSLKPVLQAYILALTGLGSDDARNTARVLGIDEFLLKPIKFKDIIPLLGL
jgi:signal transduction histidine kinase/CheY-like chemotaxis protein